MNARVSLPAVRNGKGVAGALASRRSVREYTGEALELKETAALLWAGQGVNGDAGARTAPSAHALHTLSLFLVASCVESIEPGLYEYQPDFHELALSAPGDFRDDLYRAALEDQPWVAACAALIVIAGDIAATEREFSDQPPDGKRGYRYIYIEAGAAAQNVALQAVQLKLGSVLVGGFDDDRVKASLGLHMDPLIMIALGRIA